jgi:Flp pilus assembly protein TadG
MPALRDDRGAAAVEFALVVIPLLMLVMGIIDFGRVLNQDISLNAAARQAARVMAIKNDATAARNTARAASTDLTPTLTDAQITVSPSTCTSGSTVTVTITYPMSSLTGLYAPLMNGNNIVSSGVMRCGA